MKILISEAQLRKIIKETAFVDSGGNLSDIRPNIFDNFPENILKTLESNYFHFYDMNFDWNEKMAEFGSDVAAFNKWREENAQNGFLKNLDKVIAAVRSDLILKRRRALAERKLKEFEELIIPVFGKHITGRALTKFEEAAIMFSEATPESIQKAFEDAKNLIDSEGNIDSSKMEKSHIFNGNDINIPNFERFVEANPEYQKTYDIWRKLFFADSKLMMTDTKAIHIISYEELKRLYDFLLKFKNNN